MEIYNKSLKKDEPESVEEDKEKTELSEVETVSEESSLKDAESQDAQKVTEKKDSEEVNRKSKLCLIFRKNWKNFRQSRSLSDA